ncbi:uncharacterized protein N7459_007348 [Penicillium hispanicum]|uniref:uncharacterized protein n=1 Tax=Penicillium hispanicum TaxID=1080232 RepID=UPI0025411456|nr:uncharacterized protein N7459_007348 [Penicillium hispanicum]KAJ5578384.1 hypothetical protein N7459_007348 [Penicillium hispanicum]
MVHNQGLSAEIWLLVMELLDQPSLTALAEVSKGMHALSSPVLYSKIDLSVHNLNPRFTTEGEQALAQKVFGQQNLFMQQLLDRPERALRVRSFTWTMGLQQQCELPRWSQKGTRAPIHQLENIYTLYLSLRHVTHVDINGGELHEYPYQSLPPLFPEATHIRLSGQMHYALASAILHGPQQAPLECLSLENLLECGCLKTGQNFQPQYDPRFKYRPQLLPLEEIWPDGGKPVQVAPGEMTRLLCPALQSRCSRLRRFTFGVLDLTSESGRRILPPGWCTRNVAIHDELTAFFRAVQPQETVLVYSRLSPERRAELVSRYGRRRCVVSRRPSSAPRHRLLDTLLDGWPGLQTLEIRGGNRDADFPNTPAQPFPSLVNRPGLERVQVYFEPHSWDTYHGRIGTASLHG